MSKNSDNLIVINERLKNGVIEKVETLSTPGKVRHLPHQAVMQEDHSSSKPHVVCVLSSASVKNVGLSLNSLNKAMYCNVGTCFTPLLFSVLDFGSIQLEVQLTYEKLFCKLL